MNTPAIISTSDYHNFDVYHHAYRVIGLNLHVTEVGMDCGQYVAVVHQDTPEDNQYVATLEKELSENA